MTPPPIPARLSIDPKSPFFNKEVLEFRPALRVVFRGVQINNCAEYCVHEGWVKRLAANGKWVHINGVVYAYWPNEKESEPCK